MKQAILGGSFNPIHNAHILLCGYVRDELKLDRVLLIPTGDNPYKTTDEAVSRYDRLEMTKLAALGQDRLSVSDIEVMREGVSYTIDTVRALRKEMEEQDELYIILGSDLLFGLSGWKAFSSLCKLARFVCVARKNENNSILEETIDAIKSEFPSADFILLKEEVIPPISSTMIRRMIKNRDDGVMEYIDKQVYEYITERQLYV